jgi:hypothetical protein
MNLNVKKVVELGVMRSVGTINTILYFDGELKKLVEMNFKVTIMKYI